TKTPEVSKPEPKISSSVTNRPATMIHPCRSCPLIALQEVPLGTELVEYRLGVLQVGGIESLREPAVAVAEHLACIAAAAVIADQSREAGGRAQLPRFGFLRLSNGDRSAHRLLPIIRGARKPQEFSLEPMQLRLAKALLLSGRPRYGFIQNCQSFFHAP